MIVYIVRIFGQYKDPVNDDILHKWDFGSEFYEDVDSAIKRMRKVIVTNYKGEIHNVSN